MSSWYDDDEVDVGVERSSPPSTSHLTKETDDEAHTASASTNMNTRQTYPALRERDDGSHAGGARVAASGSRTHGSEGSRAPEQYAGEYDGDQERRGYDYVRRDYAHDAGLRRGYDQDYG